MRISDWSSDVCSSDLDVAVWIIEITNPITNISMSGGPATIIMTQSAWPIDNENGLFNSNAPAPFANGLCLYYASIAPPPRSPGFFCEKRPLPRAEIGRASCRERVFQYV